jgi:hypothetical protein
MTRVRALVAVVCLSVAGLAADNKPAPPAPPAPPVPKESLKAYAQSTLSRDAHGVYIKGHKAGWSVSETKLATRDGKEVLQANEESHIDVQRSDARMVLETKSVVYFSLQGKGEILYMEEVSRQNKRETIRRAVPRGDKLIITTEINGRKEERSVPLAKRTLLNQQQMDVWLRSTPKKGDKFESWNTDLGERDVDTKETVTFLGKKKVLWGGVPTEVYHVNVLARGARTDSDVKADGTPFRTTIGAIMELRAEPETVAKKLDGKRVDLMDAASIPCDKDLGDPEEVEALTLALIDLGDYTMPTSHCQKLRKDEKGGLVLEMRRDFRADKDKAVPLSKEERAKFLEATHTIQSDKERVKKLAREIVGEETDPVKVARLLERWVFRKMRKTTGVKASTTLELLDNLAGACTEHTLLFVSLARAVGLPAREVGGVGFQSGSKPSFGWHAWAEIHDGAQWVSVDPTWHQVYVDATHIKFSDDADDQAWLNVLGKVHFKVLKVEKK